MKKKLDELIEKVIDNRGKNPEYLITGKYPVIDNFLIKNDLYPKLENVSRYIDEKTFKNFLRGYINKNMPIMTLVGNGIGNISLAPTEKACIVQNTIGFKTTDEVDELYLFYYLKFIKEDIKKLDRGSGQPSIKKTDVLNLIINYPEKKIQNKIISILYNIDKKIELNNQINDNLHDLAEQLFFEIYKNGRERTLGDLLENISTGARPKGGAQKSGIPSVGAEKIEKFGIYDYSSEKYIAEDFYEKLKNGKMNSGDVLLYKDGAYTGKVSMCLNWFPHKKSAVNEHVFILNTENNWAQNYLYFTLYNKQNKEMLERLAGAKAAQPGLNQTELKSLKINICNKEFIKKFENEVKPIMESIANNSLENKKLVELRDTLLPKLMNGEINLDKIEI